MKTQHITFIHTCTSSPFCFFCYSLLRLPLASWSRSMASNSALKFPAPKPSFPARWMISKNTVGLFTKIFVVSAQIINIYRYIYISRETHRSCNGLVKICNKNPVSSKSTKIFNSRRRSISWPTLILAAFSRAWRLS